MGLRQRLLKGTFLARARRDPGLAATMRSDAEMDATLAGALQHHEPGSDLSVFGYGSLMWDPAIEHAGGRRGLVRGWRRRFCLQLFIGRGSPQRPGVMMALDRGGACHGLILRIPADKVASELRLLWRREMAWGTYEARWVMASVDDRQVRVLTFVANRSHDRYLSGQSDMQTAELIRSGQGDLGTCREYFEKTMRTLSKLGVRDRGMERVRKALAHLDQVPFAFTSWLSTSPELSVTIEQGDDPIDEDPHLRAEKAIGGVEDTDR